MTRPGVFAAYAPVAGFLRPSVRPRQARPLFHVAGERDRVVRFADQQVAITVAIEVNGVGATTMHCGDGCIDLRTRYAHSGHDLDPPWRPRVSA